MKDYRDRLVEELASKGNKEAIFEMVREYIEDMHIDDVDAEKVELIKRYLLELADRGDKDAMVYLGCIHYEGRGVKQSYKEAFKWYEKGAEKLDAYGLCNLGYCYYYGRDIDINYEKAYSCFSQSAYLGYGNAMYKLGDLYFNGYFVEEDKEAAFFWYNEGYHNAEHKYEKASIAYRLGKCYLHGEGVERNLFRSLKMLQKAEIGFFELIMDTGSEHSEIVLTSVRKELDTVRDRLYEEYEIE